MYTEFEDDYQRDEFPITKRKELLTTESCIPTNHDISDGMIDSISYSIHQQLLNIIPLTNTEMLDMISPFTKDQNGYITLRMVMRRRCIFMQPTPKG